MILNMYIKKLEGFDDNVFISILQKELSEIGATIVRYSNIDGGYTIQVQYTIQISAISYQLVLGCFSGIQSDYDKVEVIGIPADEIKID